MRKVGKSGVSSVFESVFACTASQRMEQVVDLRVRKGIYTPTGKDKMSSRYLDLYEERVFASSVSQKWATVVDLVVTR